MTENQYYALSWQVTLVGLIVVVGVLGDTYELLRLGFIGSIFVALLANTMLSFRVREEFKEKKNACTD